MFNEKRLADLGKLETLSINKYFLLGGAPSGGLFDFLLYFILFGEEEEHAKTRKCLRKNLFNINSPAEPAEESTTHKINYSQPKIADLVKIMDKALLKGPENALESPEDYDKLWESIDKDQDVATAMICMIIGYLILDENRTLQILPKVSHEDNEERSFSWVIEKLKLGTPIYDKSHPLLQRKDKVLGMRASTNEAELSPNANPYSFLACPAELPANNSLRIDELAVRTQMVTTLTYIVLHFGFDRQNASLINLLHKVVTAREKLCKKQAKATEDSNDPIHAIVDNFEGADTAPMSTTKTILRLVLQNLFSENPTDSDLIDKDPASSATVMLFHYLVQHLHHQEDAVAEVLDYMIHKTRKETMNNHLKFILFLFPKMHIPFTLVPKLKEFMVVIKAFLMEPLPMGGYVRRTLLLCRNKILFCFKEIRERLRNRKLQDQTHVHIAFNPYSTYAKFFNSFVLDNQQEEANQDHIKASLVMSLLIFYLSQDESIGADELAAIRGYPVELLQQYYQPIDEFLVSIDEGENSVDQMQQFFQTLAQKIKMESEVYKSSPGEYDLSNNFCGFLNTTHKPVQYHVHELKYEQRISLQKTNLYKKTYPRCLCMETLTNIIGIEQDRFDELSEEEKAARGDNVVQINLMIAGGSGTIHRIVHALHIIRQQHKTAKLKWNLYHLPLGANNECLKSIASGDQLFSGLIFNPLTSLSNLPMLFESSLSKCDYYNLTKLPEQFEQAEQRQSRASVVVAKRKFMFTPRRLYDPPSEKAVIVTKSPTPVLTPHRYMRAIIDFYIMNATTPITQHIYTVQCLIYGQNKRDTPNANTPSTPVATTEVRGTSVLDLVSLIFASRIDLGVIPEAVVMKHEYEEQCHEASLSDIIRHPQFSFATKDFEVSYVPMAPSATTVLSSLVRQPVRSYQSLTIKSCSVPGDHGSVVRCSDRWLEVTSEDQESIARSQRFGSEYINSYHIGSITIDSPSIEKFHIVVDGELYGPFHRTIVMGNKEKNNYETFIIGDQLA